MIVPDKYKIIGALNERGTVFSAIDTTNGETRVLKYINRQYLPLYKKLIEMKPHKNLELIYELIVYKEYIIAVCEFINGRTIREMIDDGHEFSYKEIKSIVMQLCDAVTYISRNRIVHRDINPNNIIFSDDMVTKLIDFNIAREITGTASHDTEVLGTRDYTAPEQYGFLETHRSADVFSIGKVMNALLKTNEEIANSFSGNEIVGYATEFDPAKRLTPIQLKYFVKFLVPNMPMNLWSILRFLGFKELGDKFEDFWKD